MNENLDSFFNAKSIAVIGASNNRSKVGNIIFRKLKNQKGKVIPFNKKEKTIEGKKCFARLKDYEKGIDLAVIAVPAKKVPKLVGECGKKGVRNVIVMSSGFAEDGKDKLQGKLVKIAREYSINLLGPNSFGIINPRKNIDLTFSSQNFRKGNVVFLSQSGGLASYVIDNGFGLRAFVSVGNMAGLGFADWVEYFDKDKKAKKIICFMEELKDGKKFVDVCLKSKKKITVVFAGKTEAGKKIALSHTGSAASDYKMYSGAFRQAGVTESDSIIRAFGLREEHIIYSLKGKKVFMISNSGGAGALLADELSQKGYDVDYDGLLGTANEKDFRQALSRIERGKKNYDSVLVVLTPQKMSEPLKVAHELIKSKLKDKSVACFLGRDSVGKAVDILKKNGVSVLTMAV